MINIEPNRLRAQPVDAHLAQVLPETAHEDPQATFLDTISSCISKAAIKASSFVFSTITCLTSTVQNLIEKITSFIKSLFRPMLRGRGAPLRLEEQKSALLIYGKALGVNLKDLDLNNETVISSKYTEILELVNTPAAQASLSNLRVLNLSNLNIKVLRDDVFDNLESLWTLDLSDNQIESLPEGVFSELESLRELNLANNKLENLPDEIFNELGSIRRLNLSSNQLERLPFEVFADLDGLRYLNLAKNKLESLPEGIFDEQENLEELYLNKNKLKELPKGVFHELESLTELWLCSNHLEDLPDQVFSKQKNLIELHLFGNLLCEEARGYVSETKEKIAKRLSEQIELD